MDPKVNYDISGIILFHNSYKNIYLIIQERIFNGEKKWTFFS